MKWKQLRIPLLVFTFANVFFVFGKSILDPTIGKRTITPFVFPQVVPLPQWQLVASQPLENQTVERPPFGKLVLPGIHYSYVKNNLHGSSKDVPRPSSLAPLDIKMRYEVETDGDVKRFIKDNTAIQFSLNQPSPVVRQREGLGFYALFVYEKRAYLDACINPRGGSTFTQEQFSYNRINYDVQFNRLVLWVLGYQGLRDNRCLWTHLSIPLNQSSPETAYVILEDAWFSWYQWWQTRFPRP